MTLDEINAISFEVPRPNDPERESVWFRDGVYGRCLYKYEQFFCTVFSADKPPAAWGSSGDFPTDVLVLHHSPRSLTHSRKHKNWRNWGTGEHCYMHRDGINWRKWLAPRFFDSEGLHITYLHTNVAMDLKRGDVLCLSGHTLQPLRMTADFDLVSGAQSPGVFGVYECPWFYAESIDVYTDWPETKIDAHDPFASLLALPSPKPRQIALPGEISGDLRLVA